jgi:hypothetical protein
MPVAAGTLQEYDIEYAKWGVAGTDNSQYVLQPWNASPGAHRYAGVL